MGHISLVEVMDSGVDVVRAVTVVLDVQSVVVKGKVVAIQFEIKTT